VTIEVGSSTGLPTSLVKVSIIKEKGRKSMRQPAEWFVIQSGEHEGRVHMTAWMLSAMLVNDWDTGEPKWWAYAHCPRCHAVVQADDTDKAYGDQTWAHERWHAATDWPIPEDVQAQAWKE